MANKKKVIVCIFGWHKLDWMRKNIHNPQKKSSSEWSSFVHFELIELEKKSCAHQSKGEFRLFCRENDSSRLLHKNPLYCNNNACIVSYSSKLYLMHTRDIRLAITVVVVACQSIVFHGSIYKYIFFPFTFCSVTRNPYVVWLHT